MIERNGVLFGEYRRLTRLEEADMFPVIINSLVNEGLIATYPIETLVRMLCVHFDLSETKVLYDTKRQNGYIEVQTSKHTEDGRISSRTVDVHLFKNKDVITDDIEKTVHVLGYYVFRKYNVFEETVICLEQNIQDSEVSREWLNKFPSFVHITKTVNVEKILKNGLVPKTKILILDILREFIFSVRLL